MALADPENRPRERIRRSNHGNGAVFSPVQLGCGARLCYPKTLCPNPDSNAALALQLLRRPCLKKSVLPYAKGDRASAKSFLVENHFDHFELVQLLVRNYWRLFRFLAGFENAIKPLRRLNTPIAAQNFSNASTRI